MSVFLSNSNIGSKLYHALGCAPTSGVPAWQPPGAHGRITRYENQTRYFPHSHLRRGPGLCDCLFASNSHCRAGDADAAAIGESGGGSAPDGGHDGDGCQQPGCDHATHHRHNKHHEHTDAANAERPNSSFRSGRRFEPYASNRPDSDRPDGHLRGSCRPERHTLYTAAIADDVHNANDVHDWPNLGLWSSCRPKLYASADVYAWPSTNPAASERHAATPDHARPVAHAGTYFTLVPDGHPDPRLS